MSAEPATTEILRRASSEPVVIAGALRAVIYSLLGARGLDPSVLALIMVVVEAVVSVVLRRLVSPVGPQVTNPGDPTPPPSDVAPATAQPAATGAAQPS